MYSNRVSVNVRFSVFDGQILMVGKNGRLLVTGMENLEKRSGHLLISAVFQVYNRL